MDELDFGDFDFGDFDLSGVDFSGLSDVDMSGIDFGDFDLSGLSGLEGLDLSGLEGMDLSSVDLGNLEDLNLDSSMLEGVDPSLLESLGLSQPEGVGGARSLFGGGGGSDDEVFGGAGSDDSSRDEQGFEDLIKKHSGDGERDGEGEIPFGESASNYRQPSAEERAAEQARYERFLSGQDAGLELGAGTGAQDFGASVDMEGSMGDFNTNLEDIIKNRGGFTSQWQQSGSDRIMVNDDGSGIGINENGDPYQIPPAQVREMVKTGQINTSTSGYNAATGGTNIAPGGGSPVTLKNGKEGQLMPNGNVIDKETGKVIGTDKDVNKTTTPAPKTSSPSDNKTGEKKDDWMKYIMLLMALDAMRNKGGGSSGAVIPSLTASRGTTPYAEIQKAPGYRPGQGGVQYFGPTVYRAAGGGIGSLDAAGGRLLRGPGDGVSDDIVAQIGDSQPARLADGEYVLDARTVSEVGNGSTDAGAEKIAQMVERIHDERRNAKRGEPSKADRKLLA